MELTRSGVYNDTGRTKWLFHCPEQPSERSNYGYARAKSQAWANKHIP